MSRTDRSPQTLLPPVGWLLRPMVAAGLIGCLGCGRAAEVEPPAAPERSVAVTAAEGEPFVDVTAAAGIDFVHSFGDPTMDNIIESLGSGASWIDFDGDDDLDLYLVDQGWLEGVSAGDRPADAPRNRLYENLGGGAFREAEAAGVDDDGYGYGAAVGDVDNDGDADLLVANCGPNRLYVNRGDGTFRRAEGSGAEDGRCTAGGDLPRLRPRRLPRSLPGELPDLRSRIHPPLRPGRLSRPHGLRGSARRPAAQPGRRNVRRRLRNAAGIAVDPGRAMGVVATDFDGDGWTDLFVANDATANFLFHNLGGGDGPAFEEVGALWGVAFGFRGEATGAMAGVVGDLDGDGRPDLLVTDTTYGSLYRNREDGLFEDLVMRSGLAAPSGQWVSWGGGFFDFDNDGDLDVFQVNGDLKRMTGRPDLLLANRGDGVLRAGGGRGVFPRRAPRPRRRLRRLRRRRRRRRGGHRPRRLPGAAAQRCLRHRPAGHWLGVALTRRRVQPGRPGRRGDGDRRGPAMGPDPPRAGRLSHPRRPPPPFRARRNRPDRSAGGRMAERRRSTRWRTSGSTATSRSRRGKASLEPPGPEPPCSARPGARLGSPPAALLALACVPANEAPSRWVVLGRGSQPAVDPGERITGASRLFAARRRPPRDAAPADRRGTGGGRCPRGVLGRPPRDLRRPAGGGRSSRPVDRRAPRRGARAPAGGGARVRVGRSPPRRPDRLLGPRRRAGRRRRSWPRAGRSSCSSPRPARCAGSPIGLSEIDPDGARRTAASSMPSGSHPATGAPKTERSRSSPSTPTARGPPRSTASTTGRPGSSGPWQLGGGDLVFLGGDEGGRSARWRRVDRRSPSGPAVDFTPLGATALGRGAGESVLAVAAEGLYALADGDEPSSWCRGSKPTRWSQRARDRDPRVISAWSTPSSTAARSSASTPALPAAPTR